MRRPCRRDLLAATVASVGALAGCAGGDDAPETDTTTTTTAGSGGTPGATDGSTTTATTAGEDLDLREANVTGVAIEASGDGEYRFSVTLYHDDEDEDGYANWWQVETLGGERLGRRDLLHAHGTREFTRSATVAIPPDVDCVVVRGHDQTHGYGGQAMVVAIPGGGTRTVRQGSERVAVDSC